MAAVLALTAAGVAGSASQQIGLPTARAAVVAVEDGPCAKARRCGRPVVQVPRSPALSLVEGAQWPTADRARVGEVLHVRYDARTARVWAVRELALTVAVGVVCATLAAFCVAAAESARRRS